jgi:hypothetical protein
VCGRTVVSFNIEKAVPVVKKRVPGVQNHPFEDTPMRLHCLLTVCLSGAALLTPSSARPQNSPTTLGGHGELHYNEPDGSRKGRLDFHRFVLSVEHEFNEKFSFEAEVELEHTLVEAGNPDGGTLALEEAYIEYRITPVMGIKAGVLLVPVGIINLDNEPTMFHGVERPNVDRVIIPTTWRESGIGVFGTITDEIR